MAPSEKVDAVAQEFPHASPLILALMEGSGVAMQLCTAEGTVLYSNAAFIEHFGVAASRKCLFRDPGFSKWEVTQRLKCAREGQVVKFPTLWRDFPDGRAKSAARKMGTQLTVHPVKDTTGTVSHILAVFRRIDEALESASALQALARHPSLMLWNLDKDGTFTLAEGLGWEAMGIDPGGLLGRNIGEVFRGRPGLADVQKALAGELKTVKSEFNGRWVVSHLSPVRDPLNRAVTGVSAISVDITAQRAAEERLNSLLNQLPVAIGSINTQGIVTYAAGAGLTQEGKSQSLLGLNMLERHQNDEAGAHLRAALAGEPQSYVAEAQGRFWEVHLTPVKNEAGRVTGANGVTIDVTERHKSEALFKMAVEGSPYGKVMVDQSCNILFVNKQTEKMFGYRREELIGKPVETLVPPELEREHRALRNEFLKAPKMLFVGTGRQIFGLRKDGSKVPIEIALNPIDTPEGTCILATITDISERRRLERVQFLMAERFRLAVEAAPGAMIVVGESGLIQLVNNQTEKLLGYTRDELFGRPIETIVPASLRASERAAFLARPTTVAMGEERELSVVRKDGKLVTVVIGMFPLVTEEATLVLASMRDLTEQRRIEKEKAQLQDRFRLAVEAATNAMIICDAEGKIQLVNTAAERMWGYTREELLTMLISDLVPERLRPTDPTAPKCKALEAENGVQMYGLRKDKSEFPIEATSSILATADGLLTLCSIIDLTERKRAEQERDELQRRIQHAQKLESLGVLAGGIAHDFNNLLMAIMGNADLALMRLKNESPARVNVEQIEAAARRAAELTRQMLAYSGKGKFQVLPINLTQSVEEMAHLLEVAVSKKAILKYNFARNLPLVEADPAQISQIVMNLITNASDAIGEKSGIITISTGVMEADRSYLAGCLADEETPEGVYAYVEVSDTGSGMTPEVRARIFEPFFTTKFTGRGLGLAAVLGIMRAHKGAIRVHTEPGRGTTFRMLFPVSRAAPAREEHASRNGGWRGHGTILVVDDEDSVRAVAKLILEEAGFKVITAQDGMNAVELFKKNAANITAVLLDMTMPHLGGEETFHELIRINPEVKVILSSGYSEQDATAHFAGKSLAGFLQKPYKPTQLIELLRNVLEKKTEPIG